MNQRERGAALIETALALPVMLLTLYGVTWGVRAGVVSERAEAAVRYAGVVSAQQNPYHDYSLNALYNNLGATSKVETSLCAPPTKLFLNGGTLPVAIPGTQQTQRIMPSFWQPDSAAPFCDSTPARQYFTGATRSYLLLQSVPSMDTVVSDGNFFGQTPLGSATRTKDKFYRSPDVATLMHCAAALSSTVSSSLDPSKYGTALARIPQLQPGDFNFAPIALTANCGTGIGTTVSPPAPPLPTFTGGSLPPSSPPNPGGSPTPAQSPSPSPPAKSPSPAPSVTPSAGTSASPKPGGSGGSGGGGGTGTPTPTPSPKPGNSATPAPPCCGSPTGTPTGSPITPSPSKSPSTPAPSASPSASPTVKPAPSPSPSVPPGSIS